MISTSRVFISQQQFWSQYDMTYIQHSFYLRAADVRIVMTGANQILRAAW